MKPHIRFDTGEMALHLLDQRLLPTECSDFVCHSMDDVIRALKDMVVRGAPAIGVTAAWGCVLAADKTARETAGDWRAVLDDMLVRLAAARPTAVNLRWAVERMRGVWEAAAPDDCEALTGLFLREADAMQKEDVEICRAIGHHGATLLYDGDTVLTHCNAGALATAGYGTALGVIRGAVDAGKRIAVIADETRPFLQGARLTAWELAQDNIPVTVACDNACALLMQKGLVDCVVVGADRIASNGDTANKIGTHGVAILARHFDIPFYVAAPISTIDTRIADGTAIPIEKRPDEEVRTVGGRDLVPEDVPVYNFAFDVTPAQLISGIVTEKGVLREPYDASIARALRERTA